MIYDIDFEDNLEASLQKLQISDGDMLTITPEDSDDPKKIVKAIIEQAESLSLVDYNMVLVEATKIEGKKRKDPDFDQLSKLNGLLAVNKPSGINSSYVVNRIKHVLGINNPPRKKRHLFPKIGHGGTLVANNSNCRIH